MKVRVRVRTGDKAILIGVIAIGLYEKYVADDADLISSRVAHYKRHHPIVTVAVVLITAGHLIELLPLEVDPYHRAVHYFRRSTTPPQPHH